MENETIEATMDWNHTLTDKDEFTCYGILKKQCQKIVATGTELYEREFESILIMCSAWSIAPSMIREGIEPDECVEILRTLIKKGFVKEFKINGFPSFVPIGYWKVVEPRTYKEMPTQKEYYI